MGDNADKIAEWKELAHKLDHDLILDQLTIPHNGKTLLHNARLTIVHPFFGEPKRLEIQLENWSKYSEKLKTKIDIIIVDDCGWPPVANTLVSSYPLNLSVYRIKEDLRWNTPGALNLGITQANTEWVLIMDSDCLADPATLESLMNLKPNDKFYYFFNRNRVTNDPTKSHRHRYLPCTILFSKRMFLDIKGFDEDFTGSRSGGYGFFDNHFDFKATKYGYNRAVLNGVFITEYMEDIVGPNVQQRMLISTDRVRCNKSLYRHKQLGDVPESSKMLQFPWELVFLRKLRPS